MASFEDSEGREWSIDFTIGRLIELRKKGFDTDSFAFLNHETFLPVMRVLLKEQIKEHRLGRQAFAQIFDAATLEHAVQAFEDAIAEFLPEPKEQKESEEAEPQEGLPKPVSFERMGLRLGAMLGIDPRPHGLRELLEMGMIRQRESWRQIGHLVEWLIRTMCGGPTPANPDLFPYWNDDYGKVNVEANKENCRLIIDSLVRSHQWRNQ